MNNLEEHNESLFEKISDFFKYTIWMNVKDFYRALEWFFKNLWTFRTMLWDWRPWDSRYQEELFAFGLEQLQHAIENGVEDRTMANKKIKAIKELIYELRRDVDEECIIDLETYKEEYKARSKARYDNINRIIRGQDSDEYTGTGEYEDYAERFDGTGIETWWD